MNRVLDAASLRHLPVGRQPGRPGKACLSGQKRRFITMKDEALPLTGERWCGREDSNFHGISPTTTSTLRVYQFRHGRTETPQRYPPAASRREPLAKGRVSGNAAAALFYADWWVEIWSRTWREGCSARTGAQRASAREHRKRSRACFAARPRVKIGPPIERPSLRGHGTRANLAFVTQAGEGLGPVNRGETPEPHSPHVLD